MAAKPSGITKGDGTEASPYEVHNYEEIKWCCEDSAAIPEGQIATSYYVYILLVSDIDCQTYDVDFTWGIVATHSFHLDLNTHYIKTFYITANSSMFSTTINANFYIGNGKILNVYGYWDGGSAGVFSLYTNSSNTSVIENIAFSIDMSKIATIIYYVHAVTTYTIKNCSFWLQGDRTGTVGTLNFQQLWATSGQISCCDFYLNDLKTHNAYLCRGYNDSFPCILTNCRFQGSYTSDISSTGGATVMFMYAVTRNCVFDISINKTGTGTSAVGWTNTNSTSNYGIYNTDKINTPISNIPANYIACTTWDMDMRENANADTTLQNMGFDVIKG